MAYINRLSDINSKLDINNEYQLETNTTLANIDDNIETTRILTTNINSTISNNALNVNIVSSSNKAYLYNGAGTVAITSTNIGLVNAIDTNDTTTHTALTTTNTKLDTINTSIGTTNTTLTSTNTKLDTINTSIGTTNSTLTSTNTKLDTINTSIGTTNTTLTSTNTKLDTINTSIGTTNTTLTTTNNSLSTINQGVGFNFQGNVYGNVCNNITINANSLSTAFTWTRGTYGRDSILSYFDGSTANTDNISIFTTATNGSNLYLGTAYPINIGNATGRYYCFTLNLLPYNSISIRNNSSSNITGVIATLTSA
jgi:hypothetical protein